MESLAENHLLIIGALKSQDMGKVTLAIEEHMTFASDMLLQRLHEVSEPVS
jgi:DNA-binding GntR family transcriptional regulator